MSRRPVIGLLVRPLLQEDHGWLSAYLESVLDAGGLPLCLPYCYKPELAARLLEEIDGLLLTGGSDIDPGCYGEENTGSVNIMPERDDLERMVIAEALRQDKPTLGICRGEQALAVFNGGTLIQELPKSHTHSGTHEMRALRGVLGEIYGDKPFMVNNFHHQAVGELPEDFELTARAADGTVEGIEHLGSKFVVAVQWHPERLYNFDAPSRRLFAAFIAACR